MSGRANPELADIFAAIDGKAPPPRAAREVNDRPPAGDLHPENLTPVVRVRLTPKVINPAGWVEVGPFLHAWIGAGAAYMTDDAGNIIPLATIRTIVDVRDVYGAFLVIVDQELARDALDVLRPAREAGQL